MFSQKLEVRFETRHKTLQETFCRLHFVLNFYEGIAVKKIYTCILGCHFFLKQNCQFFRGLGIIELQLLCCQ